MMTSRPPGKFRPMPGKSGKNRTLTNLDPATQPPGSRSRTTHCICRSLPILWLAFVGGMAFAQMRTDASLGRPAQTLSGPGFVIPETLGRLAGSNLFHSFQSFNLAPGESALFTTLTPGIANVISRVTGGEASNISGKISLNPVSGTPAFIFINPAGITFGGNGARLDVPGAFHVGTADHVSFADGSRYAADLSKTSHFSSASPSAFGFLGQQQARLSLEAGATLVAPLRQSVTLAGGDLLIEQAGIFADGGDLRLATTGRLAQEVPFSGALTQGAGLLAIHDGGVVSVSSNQSNRSGSIRIQAGDLLIDRMGYPDAAGIYGRALGGSGGGARIEIDATNSVILHDGGLIRIDSNTTAPAGSLSLRSPLLSVDNAYISATSYAAGRAGSMQIDAKRIILAHGGQIVASAQSTGAAGRVVLTASELIEMSGRDPDDFRSGIFVSTAGKAPAGEVELKAPRITLRDDAWVSGYAWGGSTAATAGHIRITGGDLLLENGGKISVEGHNSEGRGSVTLDLTGSLRIIGKGEERNSSPGSDTVSTGILGHGTDIRIKVPEIFVSQSGGIRSESWYQTIPGRIDIDTQRLSLQSGGHISGSALGHSYTYGIGAPIIVNAGEFVHISGNSKGRNSTIESGARSSGGAGSVTVNTPWLLIADTALINTNTGRFGTATAGRIAINAGRIELIDGAITSYEWGHAAAGGEILIRASESILLDGGYIGAEAGNEASGGRVDITAPTIRLVHAAKISSSNSEDAVAGGIRIATRSLSLSDSSSIESSSSSTSGAGNIVLLIGDTLNVDNSTIRTTSSYAGGGNITIDGADAIRLSRSLITTSVTGADWSGSGGSGGNISIGARSLALDNGFIQANTVARDAQGGNIGINTPLLVASGNHLSVGGQTPHTFRANVAGFNVIQAAAPTGISGLIHISSPALDLSGAILALSTRMIDPGGLGRSPCLPTGGSSLVQHGRGGFAPSARDLLGVSPSAANPRQTDGAAEAARLSLNPFLPCSRGS